MNKKDQALLQTMTEAERETLIDLRHIASAAGDWLSAEEALEIGGPAAREARWVIKFRRAWPA